MSKQDKCFACANKRYPALCPVAAHSEPFVWDEDAKRARCKMKKERRQVGQHKGG